MPRASAKASEQQTPAYAVRPQARTGDRTSKTREAKPAEKRTTQGEAASESSGRFGTIALALVAALVSTLTAIYLALVYADVF